MQGETSTQIVHRKVHPVVLKLLSEREVNFEEFFSQDLKSLFDITRLKDCEKAATRIIQAIKKNEKIGIYGDYDVDGTTSCALFYHFFQMLDIEVDLFQPSRFVEGYGVHPASIDAALEKDISLLITVDCGISNTETALYAKSKNLDLIITDHHADAAPEMPDAYAIVNPNRRDEDPQVKKHLGSLAGVGVGFAVAVKVRQLLLKEMPQFPSLYPLLQFVAVGTVCDMARLETVNRRLVSHGMRQMSGTQYPGLAQFITSEEKAATTILSEKFSFHMGPMINSKGRLEHPEVALKLLIAASHEEAFAYYKMLEISNHERKRIQNEVFQAAKDQVLSQMTGTPLPASIVYHESWHEGVIGIVASKLVETFKVPALVFTKSSEEGLLKASCRSAGDLNLFDCLDQCRDLFTKFGGHKAAAGLSLPKENFEAFQQQFLSILKKIPDNERTVQDFFDLMLMAKDISPQLAKNLELLEPFGMGNKKPVFRTQNLTLESYDILKDEHVRWSFKAKGETEKSFKGISFNYISKWGNSHPDELFNKQKEWPLTVEFELGINRFRGNQYLQLMVQNIF